MIKTISRLVVSILAAGLLAMPAVGQNTGESCAAIGDDAGRLACYDAIFRAAPGPAGEGLVINSERLIPARPSGRGAATFSLACVEGAPTVSFSFAGQLISATGDIAPITLQVDQNATQVRTLQSSADNTALTFSNARETTAFLDSLNGGGNLKVRVTPLGQRSLTVDFRLAPVLGQIDALRANCR